MIRAPFRRKSTTTPPAVTPKGTPKSIRANTASPTHQTSAVNCMDEVSLCESSDWFSNNVYADVNANANDDDRIPIANNNNSDLTNACEQTVAIATLALPDDDNDSDDQVNTAIGVAREAHLTSEQIQDSEVENLYECGTNVCRELKIEDEVSDSKESLSIETPSKTNKFFTSLSKSLRSKLKQKPASMAGMPVMAVELMEAGSCLAVDTNPEPAVESDNVKSVSTLALRLREKLRRLNFVKSRPNSDDEVSSHTYEQM